MGKRKKRCKVHDGRMVEESLNALMMTGKVNWEKRRGHGIGNEGLETCSKDMRGEGWRRDMNVSMMSGEVRTQ